LGNEKVLKIENLKKEEREIVSLPNTENNINNIEKDYNKKDNNMIEIDKELEESEAYYNNMITKNSKFYFRSRSSFDASKLENQKCKIFY
jgi:hypothetical protein